MLWACMALDTPSFALMQRRGVHLPKRMSGVTMKILVDAGAGEVKVKKNADEYESAHQPGLIDVMCPVNIANFTVNNRMKPTQEEPFVLTKHSQHEGVEIMQCSCRVCGAIRWSG